MASRVNTEHTASEVARSYLSEQHPSLLCHQLSILKLEQSWLVQATPDPGLGSEAEKVVMVVNRYGFVEEVGRGSVSRHNAHRHLNGFNTSVVGANVNEGFSSTPTAVGWS